MRAAVLTHVLALQAQGAGNKELAAQAQAYLRLASELLEPAEPRPSDIGGLSGSGNSNLAPYLAPATDRRHGDLTLHTYVLRARLWGVRSATAVAHITYWLGIT